MDPSERFQNIVSAKSATTVLAATRRTEIGKHVALLRKAGRVPAVVFGHGIDSIPISLDAHEFDHIRRTIHSNTIVELKIDGKDVHRVLIHGIQIEPRHRHLLHVDLFELKSGEEVTVEVPLRSTGESFAVVRLGGTLLHNIDHIRVRALPENLPESLEYSVESILDFDTAIHLRDLPLPEGVTLLSDPDEVVAKVAPPKVEEVAAVEAPVEGAEEAAPAAEAKPEA
jgi:large subunit ribosomal protein L25